jgi:uncharacterized protein (TIGR00255 family)
MRSMTGFGVGEAPLCTDEASPQVGAQGRLTVEIRAVNHRFLDVRVRGPSQVPDLTTAVETLARERLTRGRFDVNVRIDGAALGAMVIDRERARSVFRSLAELRDELAPGDPLPLSMLGAVPDLFVPKLEQEIEQLRGALATAFESALKSLDAMRLREGLALGDDLCRRLVTMRKLSKSIFERSPQTLETYKKRLKERAEKLKMVSDVELDSGRLEQEVALFADRIDVAEELTRLESHTLHFEGLLASSEAVGRRLDFLLQEMAREANTIGSKSQDVGIAHAVVELKAEIERMREQVQNVE